jgi:hypothetical protein
MRHTYKSYLLTSSDLDAVGWVGAWYGRLWFAVLQVSGETISISNPTRNKTLRSSATAFQLHVQSDMPQQPSLTDYHWFSVPIRFIPIQSDST